MIRVSESGTAPDSRPEKSGDVGFSKGSEISRIVRASTAVFDDVPGPSAPPETTDQRLRLGRT